MRVVEEFSKQAKHYEEYNIIQRAVAQDLLALVDWPYKRVLDLGCGSGTLFRYLNRDLEYYIGVDKAKKMLLEHPKGEHIELWEESFDEADLYKKEALKQIDTLFSSSSLQWSRDLLLLFRHIQALHKPFALALFTAGTFQSIQDYTGIASPLATASEVQKYAKEAFNSYVLEKKAYQLTFENSRELFTYIKKSGVSGNRNRLSIAQSRKMLKEFPHLTLDFEVLFIVSRLT